MPKLSVFELAVQSTKQSGVALAPMYCALEVPRTYRVTARLGSEAWTAQGGLLRYMRKSPGSARKVPKQLEIFAIIPPCLALGSLMVGHAPCTHEKLWLSLACNWRGLDGPAASCPISGIFSPCLKSCCHFLLVAWVDATPFGACVPLCVPSHAVAAMVGLLVLEPWARNVDFGVAGSVALASPTDTAMPCPMV